MYYSEAEQITVKLAEGQRDWLYKEADRQLTNSSAVVRQAIKLLMEKTEREHEREGTQS